MENVLKMNAVGSFYLPLHNAYTRELSNTYSMKGFYLAEDFVVKVLKEKFGAKAVFCGFNYHFGKGGGRWPRASHCFLGLCFLTY